MTSRPVRVAASTLILWLCGCAGPAPAPPAVLLTAFSQAGLVIGSLSCATDCGLEQASGQVEIARLSEAGAGAQRYLLEVAADASGAGAVFSGPLPPGVYVLEAARVETRDLRPAVLRLPFPVRAGEVTDAGHFPLEPAARAVPLAARLGAPRSR
ncbi:MAG TPA: hypothetical protein VFV27_06935 [Nevskiaceae bacterium]|nr:hypothetical protein [Nevskiaceae bacterium]